MAKVTYIAVSPAGNNVLRSTARTYSHAIFAQKSFAADIEIYGKVWEVDKSNYRYALKVIETKGAIYASHSTEEYRAKEVAKAEIVAAHGSQEAYAKAECERRVAHCNADLKAGKYEEWVCMGFAGRLDLAQKAFARDGKYMRNAKFVEVREATKEEIKAAKGK